MKNNDWKERLNVVYSTNPDFKYENVEKEETKTLDKKQQKLRVNIEKKGRGGKTVTFIQGEFKQRVIELLKAEGYTQTK